MKIFLRTYGCQMNEYDSELIESILRADGFAFVDKEEAADIILLNTCSVRDNAQRKIKGEICEIRHRFKGKKSPIIGLLGCIASHEKDHLLADKKFRADFFAGPDSYKKLPDLIRQGIKHERPADFVLSDIETYEEIYPKRKPGVNAWVSIMRGCNNFCSFCVVPYTRGRERSRSSASIVDEVKKLADEGYPQVTLLGQNVNSYNYDGVDFTQLLQMVSQIKGIRRIRFMSPNPKDFPPHLIDLIAQDPKICKHIHFPLQSGNNRILKLMNRHYTQKQFMEQIKKFRKVCPQLAITTDIIVGFPTETDDEFEDTVKVMKQVEFDAAFIFKYSQREGTLASKKYPDDVSEKEKTRRIVLLNALQKETSTQKNRELIGQIQEVLIEQKGTSKSPDDWEARTDTNKLVILPHANIKPSMCLPVRITAASAYILKAEHVTH
ncbi:MAG: tRNA (N6-isopentenyl adenosine(37)-C2)-methylthiotransferase MiaB [Candidatus Omnitrophica bacterium]|nr:tRNA (N6-isopentenyl adenosine(37)-C2)-methylthiotransferase MiaB [Candidatus Omnitrophota bacterium]